MPTAQARSALPNVAINMHMQSGVSLGSPSLQDFQVATLAKESAPAYSPKEDSIRRRVKFNDLLREVHQITPYSEIYGIHPREFVFDRFSFMLPASGCIDVGAAWKRWHGVEEEEEVSEGDSDEDLLEGDWEHEYTM
jgi:hypothetical protein